MLKWLKWPKLLKWTICRIWGASILEIPISCYWKWWYRWYSYIMLYLPTIAHLLDHLLPPSAKIAGPPESECMVTWFTAVYPNIYLNLSPYNSMMAISSRKTHHNSPNSPLDHLKSSRCFPVSSGCHGLIPVPPRAGYRLWSHPKKKRQCPKDLTGEGTTIQQLLSNQHPFPSNTASKASKASKKQDVLIVGLYNLVG